MKKLLFAMGLGAGLAWLFDPDAGSRRRDALKSKVEGSGLGGAPKAPGSPRSAMANDNSPIAPSVSSIP
ncbi:MAG: hypothetical protein ACR2HQ_11450 [Ilumatobacteraceae bacterium]